MVEEVKNKKKGLKIGSSKKLTLWPKKKRKETYPWSGLLCNGVRHELHMVFDFI